MSRRTAASLLIAAVAVAAVSSLGCAGWQRLRGDTFRGAQVDRRVILVTLRPGVESRWRRVSAQLEQLYSVRTLAGWFMASLGEQCLVIAAPPWQSPERIATRLRRHPEVTGAAVQRRFRVLGESAPDPYAALQTESIGLPLEAVHRTTTGAGVSVAIVDTGVDVTHPELTGQIRRAIDIAGHQRGTFTEEFHGTAVGGIIAAAASNGMGGAGLAPGVELWVLRACWQDATPGSRAATCDSYSLAQALDLAIVDSVRIVNLSLAGEHDALIERLLGVALRRGVTVVVAAEGDPPSFPASVDGVIAVYSEASSRSRSSLRSDPPVSSLVAPGVDLLTTVPRGGYDFVSGSSFAAAWVSGFAALLLERSGELGPGAIADLLRDATIDRSDGSARRLDPCLALERHFGIPVCLAEPPPG